MQTIEPGTIIVADKGTQAETRFVVLPSSMQRWITALQISGPTLKDGECFCRSGPAAKIIFGNDFEVDTQHEFRMVARDGQVRCMLIAKE